MLIIAIFVVFLIELGQDGRGIMMLVQGASLSKVKGALRSRMMELSVSSFFCFYSSKLIALSEFLGNLLVDQLCCCSSL